jgi:hypothetical protein
MSIFFIAFSSRWKYSSYKIECKKSFSNDSRAIFTSLLEKGKFMSSIANVSRAVFVFPCESACLNCPIISGLSFSFWTKISVAIIHFYLVKREDFSIWYGGGFGMFASLDGPSTRFLTITEHTDLGEMVLDLTGYEANIRRIQVYPKKRFFEELLNKLCLETMTTATHLTALLFKIQYEPSTQTVRPILASEVRVDC